MSNSPTVPFDTSRLTETVLADVESSIRELPEIDEQNFDVFYDLVVRTFAAGADLHGVSTGILAMNIHGMTARRAAGISTQLWSRAKELMDRERQVELGISRARWMYSHAPCMVDPRAPTPDDLRQDAAHKSANGKAYSLTKGLLISGRRTWPGRDPGCKCVSRAVIPGFED